MSAQAGASYRERADQHKPRTVEETRIAAQRLLADGFDDYGIAAALGIAVEQARRMVGCQDCA